MQIELRPISTIKPYDNNPRQNDAGVDAVAASLKAYGFRQPIVVDEKGETIDGDQLMALIGGLQAAGVPQERIADLADIEGVKPFDHRAANPLAVF